MQPVISGKFGVEGRRKHRSLAYDNGAPFEVDDDLDVRSYFGNDGRSDEHCAHWLARHAVYLEIGLKAFDLSPVCISRHADVHYSDAVLAAPLDLFCQQNGTGAGAENRHTCFDACAQRFHHTEPDQELADRCAFAARKNESADFLEFIRTPDVADICSHREQQLVMALKITLKSENANLHVVVRLPATNREPTFLVHVGCADTLHRFTEVHRNLNEFVRIVEVGDPFNYGFCPLCRIIGFENT